MTGSFRLDVLTASHDRKHFSCGDEALDRYLEAQSMQDMRRRATVCYVAIPKGTNQIAGFYTLAASGVPLTEMPDELIKKLPRYPMVPVARLGRLAVDSRFQGQGLGAAMVWDAVMRSLRSEVAVFALVVDAKNDVAEKFYYHLGFVNFGLQARQLILPLSHLKHSAHSSSF